MARILSKTDLASRIVKAPPVPSLLKATSALGLRLTVTSAR